MQGRWEWMMSRLMPCVNVATLLARVVFLARFAPRDDAGKQRRYIHNDLA